MLTILLLLVPSHTSRQAQGLLSRVNLSAEAAAAVCTVTCELGASYDRESYLERYKVEPKVVKVSSSCIGGTSAAARFNLLCAQRIERVGVRNSFCHCDTYDRWRVLRK